MIELHSHACTNAHKIKNVLLKQIGWLTKSICSKYLIWLFHFTIYAAQNILSIYCLCIIVNVKIPFKSWVSIYFKTFATTSIIKTKISGITSYADTHTLCVSWE